MRWRAAAEIASGALLVWMTTCVVRAPTRWIETGEISPFEIAQGSTTLVFVRAGCKGSLAVVDDLSRDPALAARVTPINVSRSPHRDPAVDEDAFDTKTCALARGTILQTGPGWLRFADARTLCDALSEAGRRFELEQPIVSYPQFVHRDEIVRVFDSETLACHGIVRAGRGSDTHYRAGDAGTCPDASSVPQR